MKIDIIGTESLGVRGLCCLIEVAAKNILIDPGIALGFRRKGLMPHPVQVAAAEMIREKIVHAWERATDIVFSHFHGDHVPLPDANPYQLDIARVAGLNPGLQIWAKPPEFLSAKERKRSAALKERLDARWHEGAPGFGPVLFSAPVPHGEHTERNERVMMTRIEEDTVFVHASDIQLLDDATVDRIIEWHPNILLASGPPLYLDRLDAPLRDRAWRNAVRLAEAVDTLILDHHLLRSREGVLWLEKIPLQPGHKAICAADFMKTPRRFLEADRETLYEKIPVPSKWHQEYAKGTASTEGFRVQEAGKQ